MKSRLCSALFGTAVVLLLTIVGAGAQSSREIVLTPDADYFGFDLRTEKDVSLEQCQTQCLNDPGCMAFTFNVEAQWCFLKSDFSVLNPFEGAIAGKVVTTSGAPDIGAPPALGFLPEHIRSEAQRYRSDLLREVRVNPDSGLVLLSSAAEQLLARGNGVAAVDRFRSALAITPDDGGLWERLARAAIAAQNQDGANSWQMKLTATAAATNAYQLSRHTESRARALAALAEALENREIYRPAISTYAASLALLENPYVRARYEDLRARKGFRVVGHTIDSDSRSPRICVQFSEQLVRSGVEYRDFITVDGGAAQNIETGERELCVEGLEHGHRYAIELRAGLPAAIGEKIEKAVSLDLYVRDRASLARFTGDNFVLPGAGRHGIPVVTVNTGEVDLELYRIGERSLADLLNGSQFLRQLDSYDARTLAEESGTKIWSGVLETAIDQNHEVVTSFPVDEALPERDPGIYVLTATPKGERRESWEAVATQWFVVSDIGLTTVSGQDGLHVYARSLANAEPLAGAELQLIARNNEVLASGVTDDAGQHVFAPGLTRGSGGMAPQLVMARHEGSGFVFIDMGRAGFDLSDRGVEGRPAPGALDVMAWTERGIYRAGETVHVTALARNVNANAVDDLPLTFIFIRPDGVEYKRVASNRSSLGGHDLEFSLQENAMRGAWTVRVHTDPEAAPVAEQIFLVEDFVPDRIEFDLEAAEDAISEGEPVELTVNGRFLYGAPAIGLSLEGEVDVRTTSEWSEFPGYRFGLADETSGEGMRISLDALPVLDKDGKASFDVLLNNLPVTTGLLEAKTTIRMREGGGRAVERELSLPVSPDGVRIGIAADFSGGSVAENSSAAFRVVAVAPDGSRTAMPDANWTLLKVERNYQWYRDGGNWRYEAVDYTTKVADGSVSINVDEPARISVPVGWGRYRLEVESPNAGGPVSSYVFDAGWYVEASSTETPDGLEIALDRDSYAPGDTAKLHVSPRFGGKLLVTVGAETVLSTVSADVPEDGATIDIPVGGDWGAGAYVTATLYRPGNADNTRMPMRAIGVKWLGIAVGERELTVEMDMPDQIGPSRTVEVPISVTGAGVGEKAFVTLAAVDVGILNLTRYQAPEPEAWYFGQRRLGLQLRDIYGRLIDGSAGVGGRIRSGGDGSGMMPQGSPPTEKLVAFHSGVVELDADGKATVSFDLPRFNGTVRLMAVAWSRSGLGHGEKDVVVREPVVVTASLPRFMAPDDTAEVHLAFANTDAPAGDYTLNVSADGPVSVPDGVRSIRLEEGGRSQVTVPIRASGTGTGFVRVSLSNADGLELTQVHELPVRPAVLPVARRFDIPLAANGGSVRLDSGLLDGSLLGGASVSINVSAQDVLDIPALLMSLDRYPYGCAEQTTSRALPLLYVSELAASAGLEQDPAINDRVQQAIYRVLSYQSSSGGFGLWGPGGGDLWLDAYVTDFLTRAREQKFDVPDAAMRQALDNLANVLAYNNDIRSQGAEIAYSLYVLARNRRASAGDLRYYADTQIDAFRTPMARAQVAASLALYGDSQRAMRAFGSAYRLAQNVADSRTGRGDYGSALRDNAAMLALAAETRPAPASMPEMLELVAGSLAGKRYTSTQEQAWMLLAARAIEAGTPISITVDGVEHSGNFARRLSGEQLVANPVTIVNRGDADLTAVVTAIAAPLQPLPAGGEGFTIERTYYTMDGKPANITEARQNDRYVAVLRITEENAWPSRVLVNDLLPAGFQIDNPRLVSSADLANFAWLPQTEAAHTEFRDDRFIAAFDRGERSPREFAFAYVVRAVTPGIYAHPAASVEDMYRPEYSARTATGVMAVEAN